MGSKPSAQSNTQSSYSPPPQVLQQYGAVTNTAEKVASTPYQPYTGELVAGVNGQQNQGIGTINGAAGAAGADNASASGLANASAQAINPMAYSGQAVGQFESPYNQDVINTTLSNINNQNSQQQAQLKGNAIASGAFGGDRAGVAGAALAGQQDLATNSTIAGLENQNFQQAQQEFNTQQQTQLGAQQNTAARQGTAAGTLGQLGSTATQEQLGVGTAQVGAGTVQQQTAQNADTANYNQYLQQLAYPFQSTGWLANIVEGIGSQTGGTSTGQSTQQSGNTASSIFGGLLGLGSLLARGGRVGYDNGGGVGGGVFNPTDESPVGLGGGDIVPAPSLKIGHTMPTSPGSAPAAAAAQSPQQMGQSIGKLGQGLGGLFGGGAGGSYSQAGAGLYGLSNGLDLSDIGFARGGLAGAAQKHYEAGGTVLGDAGLMARPRFDDGGTVDDTLFNPDAMGLAPAAQPAQPALDAPAALPAPVNGPISPAYAAQLAGHPGQYATGPDPASPSVSPPATGVAPTMLAAPTSGLAAIDKAAPPDDGFGNIIRQESGGHQFDSSGKPLTSSAGAIGIAQVMPGTGPEAAQLAGLPWDPTKLATDPSYNAALGHAYYKAQLSKYGDPAQAAAAYNAGPGAVDHAIALASKNGGSYLDYLPAETQNYVAAVGGGGKPASALAYDSGGVGGLGSSGNAPAPRATGTISTDDSAPTPIDSAMGASGGHSKGLLGLDLSDNTRLGLLSAGLGILGGKSMNAFQNIGQGGLEGLQTMMAGSKNAAEIGKTNAEAQGVQTDTQIKKQRLGAMVDALHQLSQQNATPYSPPAGAPKITSPAATPSVAPSAGAGSPAGGNPATASIPGAVAAASAQVDPNWDLDRLRKQAQLYAAAGMPELAKQFQDQADRITTSGMTRDVNGNLVPVPGFVPTQATIAGAKAGAEAGAKLPYETTEVQPQPGGPTYTVPKSTVIGGGAQGGVGVGSPPGERGAGAPGAVAKQPAQYEDRQKMIAEDENKMVGQFQQRQVQRQRLGALQDIMQNYQPGAFAAQKADTIAKLRAVGIPVPDSATANPAAFQEFTKNAVQQVFSQVQGMGGKVLVSEIEGLSKANANAELQPAAAAAIIGQALGTLDYEDKHFNDYADWKKDNPNAVTTMPFEQQWVKGNKLGDFVKQANQNFGYQGQAVPPPQQRAVNQVYRTPKGSFRWVGNGWAPAGAQ